MASKLPDKVGWLLRINGMFGVPVLILQQGIHFFVSQEFPASGGTSFDTKFRIMAVFILLILGGGYFVGKGLEERKEWARITLVRACWTLAVGSVLVAIYWIAFFMDAPPVFGFAAGIIAVLNAGIPIYLAVRFNKPDIKQQFPQEQEAEQANEHNHERMPSNRAQELYSRGNKLAKQQDYEQAIGCYDKAISLAPNFTKALRNRGVARLMLGETQTANDDFQLAYDLGLKTDRVRRMIEQTSSN